MKVPKTYKEVIEKTALLPGMAYVNSGQIPLIILAVMFFYFKDVSRKYRHLVLIERK